MWKDTIDLFHRRAVNLGDSEHPVIRGMQAEAHQPSVGNTSEEI